MTTFFNTSSVNDLYYYSPTSTVIHSEDIPDVAEDFFIKSPSIAQFKNEANLKSMIYELNQEIFNSTGITYPSPESVIVKQHHLNTTPNNFTKENDVNNYRILRSENLLLRMIHCNQNQDMDLNQISLMRLSKGIFVHQKFQSNSLSSPTLSTIEDALLSTKFIYDDEAPIDTFNYNNLNQYMNNTNCNDTYTPYSYTFGIRYTNMYGNDLIIRGKIPLWCQTLILHNCLQSSIRPNQPVFGLLPFAPQIPITFKYFNPQDFDIIPELTVLYEKMTMDHLDPFILNDDDYEVQWLEKKNEILKNMLICDLPDDLAKIIDNLSIIWATTQGFSL